MPFSFCPACGRQTLKHFKALGRSVCFDCQMTYKIDVETTLPVMDVLVEDVPIFDDYEKSVRDLVDAEELESEGRPE